MVPGGAADADGRLQAGDQLLKVDGQSLIGITQERAADYLVRTGPVVILEVAKQGAIYHGLAMLLQQPSPIIQRGKHLLSKHADFNIKHIHLILKVWRVCDFSLEFNTELIKQLDGLTITEIEFDLLLIANQVKIFSRNSKINTWINTVSTNLQSILTIWLITFPLMLLLS